MTHQQLIPMPPIQDGDHTITEFKLPPFWSLRGFHARIKICLTKGRVTSVEKGSVSNLAIVAGNSYDALKGI
jgi:hypothetical protein